MRVQNAFTLTEKYLRSFGKLTVGESAAIQSEKENCDINVIVARFGQGATMARGNAKEALPSGYYDGVDFQRAMDIVNEGKEAFRRLPSKIRDRFQNDPGRYVRFVSDPQNFEEMVALGLAQKKEVPKEPPVVPPTQASA